MRDTIRPFIQSWFGNGNSTSVWFDYWCNLGPLSRIVTTRDTHFTGLNLQNVVSDIVEDNSLKWRACWTNKYVQLFQIQCPVLVPNSLDKLWWVDNDGKDVNFSVSNVWNSVCTRRTEVGWRDVVWFSECIPCHACFVWMIMRRSLKTHDRMKQWDVAASVNISRLKCVLCNIQSHSHEHLFFECLFSSAVWDKVKRLSILRRSNSVWGDIIQDLIVMDNRKSLGNIIRKSVLGASEYFIWQERNLRCIKKRVGW